MSSASCQFMSKGGNRMKMISRDTFLKKKARRKMIKRSKQLNRRLAK